MLSVGIIGRSELMFSSLELFEREGYEISFIITANEAPEYEKTRKDFELFANKIGVPFLFTGTLGDQSSLDFIRACKDSDVAISVNYSGVIPQKVIDLFPLGLLNAHAGDLPRYRGNACQAWAIINGEDKIGLCIHKMIGGELDSGDIISREYMSISLNTKVRECYDWMHSRIPHLFLDAVGKLYEDKTYKLEEQSKNPHHALRCYPRMPEDGRIDWTCSAIDILRLVNASGAPYSGASTSYDEHHLTVIDAELSVDNERYLAIPGQVAQIHKGTGSVVVITGEGKLTLKLISVDGKPMLPAELVKSIRKRFK